MSGAERVRGAGFADAFRFADAFVLGFSADVRFDVAVFVAAFFFVPFFTRPSE